jgi:DNA-binding NarL/FixJ family response regulator
MSTRISRNEFFISEYQERPAVLSPQLFPRIYICTEHPIVFAAIQSSLVTKNPRCAIHRLPGNAGHCEQPGIVIVDTLTVPQWLGVLVSWSDRETKFILLVPGGSNAAEYRFANLQLGIHGIVTITSDFEEEILMAIKAVSNGDVWFSRRVLQTLILGVKRRAASFKNPRENACFTSREEQVCQFVKQGFSNKEISAALKISERTVKFHVSNILRKSGLSSRRQLSVYQSLQMLSPTG